MRKLVLLVLIVSLGGIAWAGGGQESSKGPVTVTWWAPNFNTPRDLELAKKYMAAFPNVKVDVQETVAQGLQDKVLVALQSGSVPDVIDIQTGWNIPYASTGQVLALDSYIAKSSVVKKEDFWPANWGSAVYSGKVYGIPYRAESHGFIYNKKHYTAVGLDPARGPANWKELVAYAQKLTRTADGKKIYGYAICGGGEIGNMIFNMLPQIWMNGGDVLSSDYKKVTINEPPAVEAVQFYTDMYVKYHVSPETTLQNGGNQNRDLFAQEAVSQFQSGSYIIPVVRKANPNVEMGFAMIPPPEGKKPAAVLGGWNFMIPLKTANKNASWAFVEWLAQPDNMAYYTDTFPATATAMKNPRFSNPDFKAFIDMLPYTRISPPIKGWIQMQAAIFKEVQNVLLGQKQVKPAMDDAAAAMTKLLD
jgi:multiple sugar transport system substrate-binding protein